MHDLLSSLPVQPQLKLLPHLEQNQGYNIQVRTLDKIPKTLHLGTLVC